MDAFEFVDWANVSSDTYSPYIKFSEKGKLECIKTSSPTTGSDSVRMKLSGDSVLHLGIREEERLAKSIFYNLHENNGTFYYKYTQCNKILSDEVMNLRDYCVVVCKKSSTSVIIKIIGLHGGVIMHNFKYKGYLTIKFETDYDSYTRMVEVEFSRNNNVIEIGAENFIDDYFDIYDFKMSKIILTIFGDNTVQGYEEVPVFEKKYVFKKIDKNTWKKLRGYGKGWPKPDQSWLPRIYKIRTDKSILVPGVNRATFKYVGRFRGVKCKPILIRIEKRKGR